MGRAVVGRLVAVAGLLLAAPAAASNVQIVLDQVLGSWQGNTAVQFVELHMLADGQGDLAQGATLVFDDVAGSAASRRVFTFTANVVHAVADARVLVGTSALAQAAGIAPDFTLPADMLRPSGGRVCYVAGDATSGQSQLDCLAYGSYTGDQGTFGLPVVATPENRALVRVGTSGTNRSDWTTALSPVPQNNAGDAGSMPTLCGDGVIEQGEECDGENLGGQTCASLGFAAKGTLRCAECHADTSDCSLCGNGTIDAHEQCDGADLGGRTCALLGFTGGTLDCTKTCRLSTKTCDSTFFVPGGGPPASDCLGEWRVSNATGRPGASGRAPVRQTCADGDAGCDADATAGTCTFTVAVCLDRDDARLTAGGRRCRAQGIASWTLLRPQESVGGTDGDAATRLLAAVGALGPSSTTAGAVTFAPSLDSAERCTDAVAVVVARQGNRAGKLVLRARTATIGTRRDADVLRLVCTR